MSNYTIQDRFILYINKYIKKHKLFDEQWKIVNAILKCKTKNLCCYTIIGQECVLLVVTNIITSVLYQFFLNYLNWTSSCCLNYS